MAESRAVGTNGDMSELGIWTVKKSKADASDNHPKHRIEVLEREKRDLVRTNGEMNSALDKLAEEKAAELELSERERKAMESITKRASDFEGVVARLHHNLVISREAGKEVNREKEALRGMKREKDALLSKLCEQTDELKRSKTDSESGISELEKEIELKERESSARRENVAAEEQSTAQLDETERVIVQLKKEVEDGMAASRAELKRSEEKVTEMEGRLSRLLKRSEVAQGEIEGVAEAAEGDGGLRGLKERKRFPVAAAVSAGVFVAALAICYMNFKKTR